MPTQFSSNYDSRRSVPGRGERTRAAIVSVAIGAELILLAPALLAQTQQAPPMPEVRVEASCWPSSPETDPTRCPPNDPGYAASWEFGSSIPAAIDRSKMHPAELALGSIGISLDRAWQHTIGRDDVVIAVLDSGVLWDERELVNKIYLNRGELPLPAGSSVVDANGDGVFDVRDYEKDPRVSDRNRNGMLDGGDLIGAFSDCRDDDGNGYVDDIAGYDFFGGLHCGVPGSDNNPTDDVKFGHGTGIATTAAGEANNGLAGAGVCPRCRVLPVRVGDSFVVDANEFARGVIFAARAGASVIGSALGSYNNTPAARRAVDYAYEHGVALIASAADEYAYHHNYPSLYDHAFCVNSIRYNHSGDFRKASTFWGVNPCTNYGARISVTVPATSCSSGSTSRLAGVAGLVQSAARDAGVAPLHAEEVYQLLRTTTDDLDNSTPDWGDLRYPARKGFDQLYGYGRVNALSAVVAAERGRIPPVADLQSPGWFEIITPASMPRVPVLGSMSAPRASSASFVLDYALGVEPSEDGFVVVSSGTVSDRKKDGTLGVLDFDRLPIPSGPPPAGRDDRDRYSVTVRLRITDDRGLTGEARRSFFVVNDPDARKGYPLNLGASGEASPLLVDLDGDARDEIVLTTADGNVSVVRSVDDRIRIDRLPLDVRIAMGPVLDTEKSDGAEPVRETSIREVVVGDLLGRGAKNLVIASKEGKVYAFNSRGHRMAGFPVSLQPERSWPRSEDQRLESGILSRPTLADLDGKPGLEIIVSALDGHVYAWRGNGRPVPGFPVALENRAAGPGHRAKILSSPSVGDIDGDGRPEIVVGTNNVRDGFAGVYAIRAQGIQHPMGAFVAGWSPFEIAVLREELLPTLASGIQMSPALIDANGDGDREVLIYGVAGTEVVLADNVAGEAPAILAKFLLGPGEASELTGVSFLASPGSPLIADTDGNGRPELYAPLLPMRMLTMRTSPGIPLDVPVAVGGWELPAKLDPGMGVPMMQNYPRRIEDLAIIAAPVAADVDGDGMSEVLIGSGGYLLHAFRKDGGESQGFPKFTGGWIFGAPAVGDLDGDGQRELVSVTREGYLFAWELPRNAPHSPSARPAR